MHPLRASEDMAHREAFIEDAAGLVADSIGTLAERAEGRVSVSSIWDDSEYASDVADAVKSACEIYGLVPDRDGTAIIEKAKARLGASSLN